MRPSALQQVLEVPGYDLLDPLGKGGMGEVYLARQRSLNRTVAVKFLGPCHDIDPEEQQQRFEREAHLMACAVHPNVVGILDRGRAAGRDYLVMEYIEGGSLRDLLDKGVPVPIERTRAILDGITRALTFLHGMGIVHRDLKPSNVLLDRDGQVKVSDFGIAVRPEEAGELTGSGRPLGTGEYAAPEQRACLSIDGRADQYALAVMAYELLTGRRPAGAIKPASRLNPTLPAAVDAVLLRGLQEEPDDRYRTVGEFAAALDRALSRRSHPRRSALVGAGALVVAVSLAAYAAGGRAAPSASLSRADQGDDRPASGELEPRWPAGPQVEKVRRDEHLDKAREYARAKQPDRSLEQLNAGLRLNPDDLELLRSRAFLYNMLGRHPEALADLTRVLDKGPGWAKDFLRRGWTYLALEDPDQALADFEEALRRGEPAQAHAGRGTARYRRGEYELALEDLNQAIAGGSKHTAVYHQRGLVHGALGRPREAIADLERALKLNPKLAETHARLAVALARRPSAPEQSRAVKHAREACRLTGYKEWVYLRILAAAHAAAGQPELAARFEQDALRLAPNAMRLALRQQLAQYRRSSAGGKDGVR